MEEPKINADEQIVCPYCKTTNLVENDDCPKDNMFCTKCDLCIDKSDFQTIKIDEPREVDPKKYQTEKKSRLTKRNVLLVVGISLIIASVIMTVNYNLKVSFDADKYPVGLVDENYCKYLLSSGACLSENKINWALPRGFDTECSAGYVETFEPVSGKICMEENIDDSTYCSDDTCYLIGIKKNHDRNIPKNYVPPNLKTMMLEQGG